MVSPGPTSSTSPPRACASPRPSVTCRVWPFAWECHALRAPGAKRTRLTRSREASSPFAMTSSQTSPVNLSAGPFAVGCFGWISNVPPRCRHGEAEELANLAPVVHDDDAMRRPLCGKVPGRTAAADRGEAMDRAIIVIVGAGFGGYDVARTVSRHAPPGTDLVVLNPTDYFLYLPLLPEVAAGILDPRRVAGSAPAAPPGVRLVLGEATDVNLDARRVEYLDPDGRPRTLPYDRLVLTVGSVNKLLPIPGVAED